MKRVAIYMRVSTDRQAKEGDSIPAQRTALLKYIDDRDDLILAEEYLDDGVSGTKDDRDELQRLLADISVGKIDMVIFTKLDRWFRSIRHYVTTQETLDKYGVNWLAIWEPIYDTSTPAGRLIVNQMMSIAQFEAENTGQRIRQVFAYRLANGQCASGKTPPGYSIENKRLVPNARAAEVLNIFQFYAKTGCLADTVRMVKRIQGFPNTSASVRGLLKNETYIGRHRGNDHFCPPIIPLDLFEAVQRQLSRNVKISQKNTYIFSGLVMCNCCGLKMSGGYRSKSKILEYKCPGYYNRIHTSVTCSNSSKLRESTLEEYLVGNLESLIEQMSVRIREEQAPAVDAEKKRKAVQRRLDRLKELFLDDLIPLDEYKKDRAALLEELDAIRIPEKRHNSPVEALDVPAALNLYETMEPTEKRLFWRSVINTVHFSPDKSFSIEFL